jgi:hypothetical protein
MNPADNLLPGHDLVQQGLSDLLEGRMSECALLVLIAAPRLRRLGIAVPQALHSGPCEHRLFERLEERLGAGAHSHYNGLLRRIDSYARALEREQSRIGS